MEGIELYKDFRIRAYEDWSGSGWPKKPFDTEAEYIARPSVTERQKPPFLS